MDTEPQWKRHEKLGYIFAIRFLNCHSVRHPSFIRIPCCPYHFHYVIPKICWKTKRYIWIHQVEHFLGDDKPFERMLKPGTFYLRRNFSYHNVYTKRNTYSLLITLKEGLGNVINFKGFWILYSTYLVTKKIAS